MDIDNGKYRMDQSKHLLLSGDVWTRSDDEILEDPSDHDEDEDVLLKDSDEPPPTASQAPEPAAPSLWSAARSPAAADKLHDGQHQNRASNASDSEHLIESEEEQGDADIEDAFGSGLLELSDDEDGLILSEEDEPRQGPTKDILPAFSHSEHHVLQEALDALDGPRPVIPEGVTSAERRDLIIQGLQDLALSFLLQLALSTTMVASNETSIQDSDARESAHASDDSDVFPESTRQKEKKAPQPSYQPIRMRLAQRKASKPNKKQNVDTDEEEEDLAKAEEASGPVLRNINFPKSRHASRTIAHTLRVAEIARDALEADRTVTLRDIYYRDVALFGTQQKVNSVALALAKTLGIRRSDLNIVAASKGLAHGHLKFVAKDGSQTDCFSKEGCLIPPKEEIAGMDLPVDLRFVLIVEKDAVFRPLANSDFSNDSVLGKSILITGKGYPDMSTRELAHRLGEELPHNIPILCLVDGDPHGIEIFLNYRDGSKAMQGDEGNLTCPRMQWMGVSAEDMREAGVDREYLLPLTDRDVSKTYKMLDRDNLDRELQRELCHVLHSRKKAEIQILGQTFESGTGNTDGLLEYLRRKIVRFF